MNSDFKELLVALSDCQVRFLIVGAHAVMHHTEPRFTKDLDLWIEPNLANALRFRAALIKFGGWLDFMRIEDLCEEHVMYQIGLPPTRIDFLTSVPGLIFPDCWERREEIKLSGGMVMATLSLQDTILAKEMAGRDQDLMDLKKLYARRESLA
jgi:predicted nucleotidyltransferase